MPRGCAPMCACARRRSPSHRSRCWPDGSRPFASRRKNAPPSCTLTGSCQAASSELQLPDRSRSSSACTARTYSSPSAMAPRGGGTCVHLRARMGHRVQRGSARSRGVAIGAEAARSSVIPYGVDSDRFRPDREARGARPREARHRSIMYRWSSPSAVSSERRDSNI